MQIVLIAPLLALLAGVVLQLLLGKWLRPLAKGWLALASGLAALGSLIALAPAIAAGGTVDTVLFHWQPDIAWQLHADGLGLLFALMAAGIGSAILVYCIRYMASEPAGTTRFYAFMLTFIAGLINLVFSANLLVAYLSWEVIGLCSYFLVGFWYKEPAAAAGARKVLLMTHLPGYALLFAILWLYSQSGTFVWTDPALTAQFSAGVFLLMLLAAMAKSVLFPLHTWIPEAMNAPTPVSALLHSACYVKAGVYWIARMYSFSGAAPGAMHWPQSWNTTVLVIGCLTMVVGALFALVQTDLKRLLAFSTISQLGYIITGLGLGTPFGLAAGLFYCFSHGLFKGTLFLCAGAVQHAAGTRDMRQLGGLARFMPHTARIWLVAAAAIVGVPLTNGFVAKWLLLDAALDAGQLLVVVVAWLVSAFTAFYILKATVSVFYGELPPALAGRKLHEVDPSMRVGMGFLAGCCVLIGIAPQVLMSAVVTPAVQALAFVPSLQVSWIGVQTAGAGFGAGGGLVVLAVLVAGLIYAGAVRPRPAAASVQAGVVSIFTGGDPLPAGDRLDALDFSDLAATTFRPVLQAADPDPLYQSIWGALKRLADGLAARLAGAEERPLLACLILGLLVLALALLL